MMDSDKAMNDGSEVATAVGRVDDRRCCCCSVKLANVIIVGIGFMLLFTAFQTSAMLEQTVLHAAAVNSNHTFTGSGYTSLSIIYAVFAASNWIAPSVVLVLGPKWSMMGSAVLYCLFIASFLKPMVWTLYLGSVLVGLAAAVLWTAQGNFLTINSDSETMGRNSSIFWALMQMSLLAGNLYVYLAFNGKIQITSAMQTELYLIFTVLGVLGVFVFIALRQPPPIPISISESINSSQSQDTATGATGAWAAFKNSLKLMVTRDMLLLSIVFAYTGFELTFWSGVYGTCVGATLQLGANAKRLIGLCGVFIGIGEIFGGGLFGLLGRITNRHGRDPIVLLGFLTHMLAFLLIFLFLPAASPHRETSDLAYIKPNSYLAVVSAFLLGFGDSSFNTQIYSLLGSAYSSDSAPAFAIFKFIQSLASAVAFVYSQLLFLHWQLLIMVVFAFFGSLSFFKVEWKLRGPGNDYIRLPQDEST